MPSGLIRKTNSVTTSYSKIGGSLVFSQGYNGLVYVIIFYPSIEQIVETNPNQKVLKRIEPNEIGSGFIRQRIAEFLDEISDWENTANSKSIGYK